jgi:hypothetical protein
MGWRRAAAPSSEPAGQTRTSGLRRLSRELSIPSRAQKLGISVPCLSLRKPDTTGTGSCGLAHASAVRCRSRSRLRSLWSGRSFRSRLIRGGMPRRRSKALQTSRSTHRPTTGLRSIMTPSSCYRNRYPNPCEGCRRVPKSGAGAAEKSLMKQAYLSQSVEGCRPISRIWRPVPHQLSYTPSRTEKRRRRSAPFQAEGATHLQGRSR